MGAIMVMEQEEEVVLAPGVDTADTPVTIAARNASPYGSILVFSGILKAFNRSDCSDDTNDSYGGGGCVLM